MVPGRTDIAGPGILDLGLDILREDALQPFGDAGADALMAVERHGKRTAGDQSVPGIVAEEVKVAVGVGDRLSVGHHGVADIVAEGAVANCQEVTGMTLRARRGARPGASSPV